MEGLQRRRRPAATYGKTAKKRYSEVPCGDIFSPTGSPEELKALPEEEQQQPQQQSSRGGATTATSKPTKAQKTQLIANNPSSTDVGGASLLLKDGQKKAQATMKGKNKRPIANSAVTSPPKHSKVFNFTPSDDDDNIPQPQKEDKWRHKGIDEFDVPSSGDEESFAVRKKPLPNRLPKAPGISTTTNVRIFGKETKKARDNSSAQDSKPVRKDSTSKKDEIQTAKSKEGGANISKIKKPPPAGLPARSLKVEAPKAILKLDETSGTLKSAKRPIKPSNKLLPKSKKASTKLDTSSLSVEIEREAAQRLHIQPSLESHGMAEHVSEQTVRHTRTKSSQTKSKIDFSNGPAKPNVVPVISEEIPLPPLSPQQSRRDSIPYFPGIFAQADALSTRNLKPEKDSKGTKGTPRFSEIFQSGGNEKPAPQRRRLIDRLGTGQSDFSMLSSESESSDGGPDEYTYTQQSISQSQSLFESQPEVDVTMEDSQFTIEPIVKPVYNNGGPKVTYAQQRSFRAEEVDETTMFNVSLVMSQQSFGNKGSDNLGGDEDLEGETGSKMMKSVHELREAGVNNRFLDDIEEIFGDIEGDSPISRRRSGFLELAGKMREKSFVSKFRANNFTERLCTKLNKQTDEIVCFSLSYILCCLLLEDSTVQVALQARGNGLIPMLLRMLDFERDIYAISRDRKTNMSKAAQSMVKDLRAQVEKSPIFFNRRPKVFSPQIIALKALEQSVRKLRESGVSDDVLSAGGLEKLVHILNPFTATNSKGAEKGRDTFVLELAISTLESHAVGSWAPAEQKFSPAELKVVAALIPAVVKMDSSDINDILLLILRFSINLTNNRAPICNIFAESSLISALVEMVCAKFDDLADISLEMNERLIKLDLLILSLGLLINFAELSDRARCAVDNRGAPTDEKTLLDKLLNVYLERQERAAEADSEEESQSNVAFGYLSILLGNLCQNSNVREKVRLRMPNTTLQPLFSSLEEFVAHHRKVDDQYESYDGGPNAAFTERLDQMVRRLKEG